LLTNIAYQRHVPLDFPQIYSHEKEKRNLNSNKIKGPEIAITLKAKFNKYTLQGHNFPKKLFTK